MLANLFLLIILFAINKCKNSETDNFEEIDEDSFSHSLDIVSTLNSPNTNEEDNSPATIREDMQKAMQKYASVYKDDALLTKGYAIIKNLLSKKIQTTDKTMVWNTDLLEALELRNMLSLAYVTAGASIYRQESRGSHFRNDFPERDDKNRMHHTLSWLNSSKEDIHSKCKVNSEGLYPDEMDNVPPAKRVY